MRLDRVQAADKELVLQRKEPHTEPSSTPWGTIQKLGGTVGLLLLPPFCYNNNDDTNNINNDD